ncbi:MAG: hypothetical protein KDI75_02085 [Xanthomonadales bacterium]|nr:hypothetical protein [Xanthomonadales bacterium]
MACERTATDPATSPHSTQSTASADPPFCTVARWGPQRAYAGERFNARDSGYSAFWFIADCNGKSVMLDFDDNLVEVLQNPEGFTASVNADGILANTGTHPMVLYNPDTRARQTLGSLHVLPPRHPVSLPPPPPRDWPALAPAMPPPTLVAHAGGAFHGRHYLNSRDALDHNYARGHRLFELDFCWTQDDHLVAIHDWKSSWQQLFPDSDHARIPDLSGFLNANMVDGQTQLDLTHLREWLVGHPDAFVVTDIRGRNLYGLQRIKAVLGPQFRQVIPQMYYPHRYPDIRALGYEQIIFTLYGTSLDTSTLLALIRRTPLYAVTLNPSRPDAARILAALRESGPPAYVHTFNDPDDLRRFQAMGAHGLYTDRL